MRTMAADTSLVSFPVNKITIVNIKPGNSQITIPASVKFVNFEVDKVYSRFYVIGMKQSLYQ